jgi:hypothetical protein
MGERIAIMTEDEIVRTALKKIEWKLRMGLSTRFQNEDECKEAYRAAEMALAILHEEKWSG